MFIKKLLYNKIYIRYIYIFFAPSKNLHYINEIKIYFILYFKK